MKRIIVIWLCVLLAISIVPIVLAEPTPDVSWKYTASKYVDNVVVSSNGQRAAFSCDDGSLRFFNTSSNTPLWTKSCDAMHEVALSENGRYLAVAHSVYIKMYDTAGNGKLLWSFEAMGSPGRVDISRDGNYVAALGKGNGRVYFFNRDDGSSYQWCYDFGTDMLARGDRIYITEHGEYVAAWSKYLNKIYFFEGAGYTPSDPSTQQNSPLWTYNNAEFIDLSENGQYVVVGTTDSRLILLQGAGGNGTPIWEDTNASQFGLHWVSISGDGTKIVALEYLTKTIHLYNHTSNVSVWTRTESWPVYVAEIDYYGEYICYGWIGNITLVSSENVIIWENTEAGVRDCGQGYKFGDSLSISDHGARITCIDSYSQSLTTIYMIGTSPLDWTTTDNGNGDIGDTGGVIGDYWLYILIILISIIAVSTVVYLRKRKYPPIQEQESPPLAPPPES